MCRRLNKKAPFIAIWNAWKVSDLSLLWLLEWLVSLLQCIEKERDEATC